MRRSYTKEQLAEAIKVSTSLRGALLSLGMSAEGRAVYTTLRVALEAWQIDYSHCIIKPLPPLPNQARPASGGNWDLKEVLIKNSPYKGAGSRLLRRLIYEGIFLWQCKKCKRADWQGKPIPLELDHINGDCYDFRLSNLRPLCPNCHSQTPNFTSQKPKKQ